MPSIPTVDPQTQDVQAPKRPWGLIIGAALIVVCSVGTSAWLFLNRQAAAQAPYAAAPPRRMPPPGGPPLFVALEPPFVANFDGDQQVRFLQITAQVMTHDQQTQELVKANDPLLRNDLLLLFSNQKAVDLQSHDGREALRAQALAAVRQVSNKAGGQPDLVDAVLFTSFVMQ